MCEICPVCFWEDDGQDEHDGDEVGGGPNYEPPLSQGWCNSASSVEAVGRTSAMSATSVPMNVLHTDLANAGANSSPGH
jgi:hypothetical protein